MLSIPHRLGALLLLAAALAPRGAQAHEVRPAYLQIRETAAHRFDLLWKQPIAGEVAVHLRPQLPNGWFDRPPSETMTAAGYRSVRWSGIAGTPVDLEGQTLSIEGLDQTITDVLLSIEFADGQHIRQILRPASPSLKIKVRSAETLPVFAYLRLGVEHILTGFDHLAFVFGLMLLVKSRVQLFKTITAFTLAHSLTLAAAAMHWVQVKPAVVEALVALSILFVAVELVRVERNRAGSSLAQTPPTLALRRPWLIAFAFGLLHGLAFAGALTDVGLPPDAIPLALFLFNAGVEVGQLLFVAAASALIAVLHYVRPDGSVWLRWVPPYAIGSLASGWLIERLLIVTTFRL